MCLETEQSLAAQKTGYGQDRLDREHSHCLHEYRRRRRGRYK